MAKKKRIDPIKQREKRMKIIAGIGGLLLIGVGAIEIPSVLSSLNRKPPPANPAHNPVPIGGTLALPQVGTLPSGAVSTGELADTDAPPTASGTGQLVSFNVFVTKNPFTPQVSATTALPTVTVGVVPGASTTPTATTPTATTPLTPPASTVPTPAQAPTVAISVNGSISRVSRSGTFPTGAPVFRLVSFERSTAQIAIVGGSYATGGQTLTLRRNEPVTLQNTHDGKQYKLILISTP